MLPNKKPSPSDPAVIPFVPLTPAFCDGELHHMCETSEWDDSWPVPVISVDLITKFLSRVHSFTAVGLEAQATAFSFGQNGTIRWLALLPQINEVHTVTSRDEGPTEFDAVNRFSELEPSSERGTHVLRCWIHTHPRFKAFMSSTDITSSTL